MINGKTIQNCEASNVKSGLKCKYIEFSDNLVVKFNGEIDSEIANFWNEIEAQQTSQIEVKQIRKRRQAA